MDINQLPQLHPQQLLDVQAEREHMPVRHYFRAPSTIKLPVLMSAPVVTILFFAFLLIDFYQKIPLHCSHCDIPLMMTDRKGIEIDFCNQCRGV